MRDIVEKIDRLQALVTESHALPADSPLADAKLAEAGLIAIDFVGELIANSRLIALALEAIAANTKPVKLTAIASEVISAPGLTKEQAHMVRQIARAEVDRGPTKLGGNDPTRNRT